MKSVNPMNTIPFPMLTLGLLLAFTLGGCSAKPSAPSAKPSAIAAKPPPKPELWLDEEAADMFKHVLRDNARCDEVYVIRWKNCEELHGWVKLDDKGGSEPAPYDLTILPKNLSADNATFKRRDFGLSGWVVITMRTLPNTPGKAFNVRVEQGIHAAVYPRS